MSIVDMLVEGDEFRRDGGYNLPSEWRFLARAEAGDPEAVETVARHKAGSDDESALRMAADRLKSPTDWRAANALAVADDSHLGQWRTAFLGRSEGRTKRVALMDSTTLYTAVKLVDGDDVGLATPLTVLDLVTFLNTLCLYDRICFLRNPAVPLHDLESRFGPELFVELPVEQAHLQAAGHGTLGDMREDLRGLYRWRTVPWINDVRQGRLGTKAQRQVWVDTWETILEGECDPDWLLRDPDEGGHDLFSDLWNTPAKLLFYDIVKAMTDELRDVDRGIVWRDHGARVRVAQESNARAFFNVNLAQALEVPYVASTARLPTLHHIIVATQANLAELVNLPRAAMLLDQVYGEALPLSVRREGDVLQLPFFASAVLQRAFRPTEIPEVLAEVRDAVRPLRDRLFAIEEHVQSAGPAARRELQAMRAAFAESSPWEKILPSAELGAAIGHVVILWADPVLSLAAIVVSLLHTVIAVGTAETILGASRPHYRVVRRFGLDGNSADAAARLWSIDDQQAWTARVNRIASVAGSLA